MESKTDIEVLTADEHDTKRTIGWVCYEYNGAEVTKDGKTPLTKREDIQEGYELWVPTLFGYYKMIASNSEEYGGIYASSGRMIALLEFDKDDRHCWTSSGCFNAGAVRQLTKNI